MSRTSSFTGFGNDRTPPLRAVAIALVGAAFVSSLTACVEVEAEMETTNIAGDWRDEIIYQVMIDRFEDGDVNNNFNVDYRREASYHGGDWQGLIDRLDYIEDLGVTALWISPVVKNVEEDAGFASYHGYWTQSFIDVNPHFGTLAKLQDLVRACHARDIKVILDVVTNHVGQLFFYDINRNGNPDDVIYGSGGPPPGSRNPDQPGHLRRATEWDPDYDSRGVQGFTSLGENGLAPIVWIEQPEINRVPPEPPEFHNSSWYNRRGRVTVWQDNNRPLTFKYMREQEMLGDFPGGLKDLNTQREDVRRALTKVFQHWIRVADFDGFRIDTLKHQETEFFQEFARDIRSYARSLGKRNFFMFGEAFDGKDALLGSYTQGESVDSVFYFSAKYQVFNEVFGSDNHEPQVQDWGWRKEIVNRTSKARELFDQRNQLDDRVIDDEGNVTEFEDDDIEAPRYANTPKTNGPVDDDGNPLVTQQLLVNFMDNHDVPRFLDRFPELEKLHNALVYQLTFDGVPCIYYGTEQEFSGGPDPSNREDMWHSNFDTTGETYKHVQKLIRIRRDHAALRRGHVVFRCTREEGPGLMAFERVYARDGREERALVLINTHDTNDENTLGCPDAGSNGQMVTGFADGTALVDVLNNDEATNVGAEGTISLVVPPRGARILVPAGAN